MSKLAFTIKPDHVKDFPLTPEVLAALFVTVTAHWYDEPGNTLYGRKESVAHTLIQWLRHDRVPGDESLRYAIWKFEQEWLKGLERIGL